MGTISLQMPTVGQLNSTEEPKIPSDFGVIQTWANGNVDTNNISPTASIARTQLGAGAWMMPLVTTTISGTVAVGTIATCNPSITITLPAPISGGVLGINPNVNVTGAAPVTVNYGAGGGAIYGVGLPNVGVATFKQGMAAATVILESDGVNWIIVSGQQDSGWVALPLAGSIGSAAGFYTPAARLQGNMVVLRGGMQNNTGSALLGLWATVVAGFRPAATVVDVGFSNAFTAAVGMQMATNGQLTVLSSISNGSFVSLDGTGYALI